MSFCCARFLRLLIAIVAACGLVSCSSRLVTVSDAPARTEPTGSGWGDIYHKRADAARGWKYIVLHHSATAGGSDRSFDKYHREKGYGGLAYHFVIGNGRGLEDGELVEGFRWKEQIGGTHCSNRAWYHDVFGIGICLVGDFNKKPPTGDQIDTLVATLKILIARLHIERTNILGHNAVPQSLTRWTPTAITTRIIPGKFEKSGCPGALFPINAILERVFRELAEERKKKEEA